jgi:hypothetical protein
MWYRRREWIGGEVSSERGSYYVVGKPPMGDGTGSEFSHIRMVAGVSFGNACASRTACHMIFGRF